MIHWLTVIENALLPDKVDELKEQNTSDWWDKISEAEKWSISRGLEDADAGRLKPHSDARAIYEKRLQGLLDSLGA